MKIWLDERRTVEYQYQLPDKLCVSVSPPISIASRRNGKQQHTNFWFTKFLFNLRISSWVECFFLVSVYFAFLILGVYTFWQEFAGNFASMGETSDQLASQCQTVCSGSRFFSVVLMEELFVYTPLNKYTYTNIVCIRVWVSNEWRIYFAYTK